MTIASIADFRTKAKARLPRFLFDYIDGGSYGETTLRRNVGDLAEIALRQRVMKNVSAIDLSVELLGRKRALPVVLGPIGLAGLFARRGEAQAARAAQGRGVPFCLSTVSACSLAEVRRAVTAPFWFQLYVLKDRGFMREILARAAEAACEALVFTVDLPMPGARHRDVHSGLAGAPGMAGYIRRLGQILARPGWAFDVGLCGRPHSMGNVASVLGDSGGLNDFLGWLGANFDPSVTWDDLAWVRQSWKGPLIVKGILDAEDAREAARLGADAVVVSNHGGRQLDGVVSTTNALPRIAEAVGGEMTVLADGGVRSGLDVVRMLALGADGVMLGRAWAYALAAGGEAGVTRMLDLLAKEMTVAMALTGATRVDAIDGAILDRAV